jgi:hypothetical protein
MIDTRIIVHELAYSGGETIYPNRSLLGVLKLSGNCPQRRSSILATSFFLSLPGNELNSFALLRACTMMFCLTQRVNQSIMNWNLQTLTPNKEGSNNMEPCSLSFKSDAPSPSIGSSEDRVEPFLFIHWLSLVFVIEQKGDEHTPFLCLFVFFYYLCELKGAYKAVSTENWTPHSCSHTAWGRSSSELCFPLPQWLALLWRHLGWDGVGGGVWGACPEYG